VIEGRAAYGCSRWNDGCALRIPKDFQGFAIRPQHVRELVTRGIVLAPVTIGDQGQRILCATKNGEVFAIEPPSASAQGRGERSQGRGSARPGSAPRRAPSSQPDGEAKPKRRAAPKKKPRERGNEGNA